MSAGEEKIILCADCGKEVLTRYSNRRFCKECAKKRQKIYEQRSNEKKRMGKCEEQDDNQVHTCDSPENIKKCLSCKKEDCNNCLGGIYHRKRYVTGKGRSYIDAKDEFLACMKSGMGMTATARKVGISCETGYKWKRRLKEEGLL